MPEILGRARVCAEEKELTQRAQRKMAQRTRRRGRREGGRWDGERREGERPKREKNGSEDPPLQRIAEGANREIGVPRKCGLLRNGREMAVIMVWGVER